MVAISDNKAYITACEKNKIRSERLKYNLNKQGARRVNIMQIDARNLDDFLSFDKILLDAPCSGSGTIYIKDKKIEKNFTEDLIKRTIKIQNELLKKAINLLKKGNEMVYSTCSILKEENENIVEKFINSKKIEIIPIKNKLIERIPLLPTRLKGTICVCPTELYEGFFLTKIRKI